MKFKNFYYFTIFLYLISSGTSYSIEQPDIKNLIIHEEKKIIKGVYFFDSLNNKKTLDEFKNNISLINCYFEAISGFTSTGFTVFNDLKQIDQTLILWRSSSQWIGGLYFLFSILLLIDLFDENLKRSLTNYISLNSSEIFNLLGICLILNKHSLINS